MIRVLWPALNRDGVILMEYVLEITILKFSSPRGGSLKNEQSGFLPYKDHCTVLPYLKGSDIE
jgi:hypothetical protein